ncbi:MAG: hypothetical protein L3J52_00535 [Proteobacteria bacterium]|nr:hypothetical protein [Pseudomonadota bacterium]
MLLLLGNVGFYVWLDRFSTHNEKKFIAVDPGIAKLELLSEVSTNPQTWLKDETKDTSLASSIRQLCFSVGPFISQAEIQPATELLNPLVLKTSVRKVTTTQEAGYWVYVPALSSRLEALKKGRELAAANVKDYYVVTTGNHENTVALGLYRESYNADNRINELALKGFEVKKEVRIEQWPEFWLDYSVTAEQLPAVPELNSNNSDILQNEVRCNKQS